MTGWLDKLFSKQTAARAGRENPVMLASVIKSSEIYGQTPLSRLLDSETQDNLSRRLFLEINETCNSLNPVTVCREKLASAMMRFASYQVLVIPPAPEPDSSGLRGQPGITGELGGHIVKIAQNNFELRSEVHGLLTDPDPEEIRTAIEKSFWIWYWFLESFNAARQEIGDFDPEEDWYPAFQHAACASKEGHYRRESNLPSAFEDEISTSAPTAYGIFTDIVLSGARHPDREWREYHSGSKVPQPDFSQPVPQ